MITILKSAIPQLRNILNGNKYIFFGIKGGGCNGFKYILEPINEVNKNDIIINDNKLPLVICNKSILHIIGTEIDWVEDYMGSRFVFNNPVAKGTCGCGSTFSV